MAQKMDRRQFITTTGGAVLGAIAAAKLPGTVYGATGSSKSNINAHRLPYNGIRIIESSKTLAGRLAGLLFADQGAEVFIERKPGYKPNEHDEYLDRNKIAIPPGSLTDTSSADVIIVDGDANVDRLPAQTVLRITAALPGDEAYGHLPADCSEDLLNALVGFYTDMGTTSRILGRPVI